MADELGRIERTKKGTTSYVAQLDNGATTLTEIKAVAKVCTRAEWDAVAALKRDRLDAGDWTWRSEEGKVLASVRNKATEEPPPPATLADVLEGLNVLGEEIRGLRQELKAAKTAQPAAKT